MARAGSARMEAAHRGRARRPDRRRARAGRPGGEGPPHDGRAPRRVAGRLVPAHRRRDRSRERAEPRVAGRVVRGARAHVTARSGAARVCMGVPGRDRGHDRGRALPRWARLHGRSRRDVALPAREGLEPRRRGSGPRSRRCRNAPGDGVNFAPIAASPELRAFDDEVCTFLETTLAATDPQGTLRDVHASNEAMYFALAERGWLSPTLPKEHGGAALDPLSNRILEFRLREYAATAGPLGTTRLVWWGVEPHLDDALRDELRRGVTSGHVRFCLGY